MILMHQNTPVARIVLRDGRPYEYGEIFNRKDLPLGTVGQTKEQEHILLKKWYESRAVPAGRKSFKKIEEILGLSRAQLFLADSGISLTDTYWMRDEKDGVVWEEVNFHDNGFAPYLADYLFFGDVPKAGACPDYTTDGIMDKFWYADKGIPYLAKFSQGLRPNEAALSANEVVYYKIAASAGMRTTPYFAGDSKLGKYCTCRCFVTDSTQDFVTGMQAKFGDFSRTGEGLLKYFADGLGFGKEINQMVTLDVLLHNTDRHEKNFGYIRDNDGIFMVPPFDNGYCLGAGMTPGSPVADGNMKLFTGTREEILERWGVDLPLDYAYCKNVLRETYEYFAIEEAYYERAKEELDVGFELLQQMNSLHISHTEDHNR